jgi:predicted permease
MLAALRRVGGLFGSSRRDLDLASEIESHLQMHIDDNVRAGMTPGEARRQAILRFGGVESVKDAYRDRRSLPLLEMFVQDLRLACRLIRKHAGFTVVAVSTLALGMTANVVIFGLANALFLRPQPISNPSGVIRAYSNRHSNTSYKAYEEYRDRNRTLSGLAIFQGVSLSLRASGPPEHVFGMVVSGNYFEVLGVSTARGRLISSRDDRAGSPAIAVLSDRAWHTRFGADPDVLGRVVMINGHAYTISGVAPERFDGMLVPFAPELFMPWNGPGLEPPSDPSPGALPRDRSGHMLGRLLPSFSRPQAQADLTALAAARSQLQPRANLPATVTVYPADTLGDEFQSAAAAFVGFLFAIVGLVLLIACVNLATLLLARSTARTREISIRLSLGASRRRLISQLLTESLVVSSLGGVVALAMALSVAWTIEAGFAAVPTPIPLGLDLAFDWRVVTFAAALILTTTVLFGLVPAMRSAKTEVLRGLKEGSTSATSGPVRSRLRAVLVVAQVAMSVVLLIVGAVLVRSMLTAKSIDRGFAAEQVLTASIDLEARGYSRARGVALYEQLLERLEASPGIQAANMIDIVPLTLSNSTATLLKEGQAPPPPERAGDLGQIYVASVTRGHFRTMSIPLLAGRDVNSGDVIGRPDVTIVNEALASRFWPGENPIGKRLRTWDGGDAFGPWIEVVGLARNSKYVTVGEELKAFLYRPIGQRYTPIPTLLVKSAGVPSAALPSLRSSVQSIDPELPLFNVSSLEAATSLSLVPVQAAAILAGGLGVVALLLVAIGLYGVVSHLVRQRTREIGIRMALGAQPEAVVRQLAWQGLRWTLVGLTLGVCASLLLTQTLAGLLYGVAATDALSFVAITGLMFGTSYGASYLPARRATRVDPLSTLRYE